MLMIEAVRQVTGTAGGWGTVVENKHREKACATHPKVQGPLDPVT